MLKVDTSKWQQDASALREQALTAAHPRSRERLMALYEISRGKNASQVGRESGRNPQTVMGWVHTYNKNGPDALLYRRSGGHPPLCQKPSKSR